MPRQGRPTGVLAIAFVAAACAMALAACGSGKSGNRSSSDPGVKFAECMRIHGVPRFTDPGPGGGIQIPNGVNPASPAFQSAQKDCAGLIPAPGGGREASESRKLQMLRLSQCMRRHGLSTFPDPVSTPPQPPSGGGVAFGEPGSFIAVGQGILQSPGFQQAAAACGFPGAGHIGKATPAP